MARTYGKATDLIDFTRASSGTALRRVKYGAELVTNGTFDTDSDWTLPTGFSIGSGVMSYDGTGSAFSYAYQSVSTTVGKFYAIDFDTTAIGGTIAFGIYKDTTLLEIIGSVGHTTVFFVATGTSTNIIFKTQYINTQTYSIDNVSVREITFDTSDGDLVLFNHPNNIPRIEYDANGNLLGLLVEESRSNILPYSQAFDAVDWLKTRGDVASESISDPFGGQGAFSWTANEFAESYIADGATISSGATVTFSAFIKKKTADHCHLLVWDNSANGCRVWFDLVNGQVGTNTSFGSTFVVAGSSITESANGWYRCSMTVTTSGSTTAVVRLQPSNGNGDVNSSVGKSIYIYGAQAEVGSFPTSYIPTSGSAVTRSADVASLSTSAFGYRQDEGSIVVETNLIHDDYRAWFVSLNTDLSNRFNLGTSPSNQYRAEGVTSGVQQWGMSTIGVVTSGNHKLASGIKQSDVNFTINGVNVNTDTANTIPYVESVVIGQNTNGNIWLNGYIKSLKYYPRRLTNAQLQELTS